MSIYKIFYKYFYKNNIKTTFLIDILYMKDINAVYGFENGDYLIKQLNTLLNTKIKKEILKKLHRQSPIIIESSHVDVFNLTIYEDLSKIEIINLKKVIFNTIISHEFSLLSSSLTFDIGSNIGDKAGVVVIDLGIIIFKFGLAVDFNFTSIIGLATSYYILRYFR